MDLPYQAEYAKSGRASCNGCKSVIEKGTLRLATMVQSHRFDSKVPKWYHFQCFFDKQRPKTVDDIQHFEELRWEDQTKIKEKVEASGAAAVSPPKKGKKREAASAEGLQDFKIEYTKSGRAACRGCEQKIMKDEIRISKKDFESESARKYGGQDRWHHLGCFAKLRSDLRFFVDGNSLPGFDQLKKDDQNDVKNQLPAIKQESAPEIKKVKKEDDDFEDKEIAEQNKIMFEYRDILQRFSRKELVSILEFNDQAVPSGVDSMLDRLCDIMTFGALKRCSICKQGQLVFKKVGYICEGNLTEWTKCGHIEKTPERIEFKLPEHLKGNSLFPEEYKYVPRTRVIKTVQSSTSVKKEEDETDYKPKVERDKPPLHQMEFVILGKPPRGKDEIKTQITKLGGKVVTKIGRTVMAIISTAGEVKKMNARMSEAQIEDIHVVSEDFVDLAKDYAGRIPDLVLEKSIANWGSNPNTRLPADTSTSQKSKSMYAKSGPSKIKMTIKGGSAVDPDSGRADTSHIYCEQHDKYTAVLGVTDIQQNRNSFYKLQIIESDEGNKYWLFRSWGRIGTNIQDHKLESKDNIRAAKYSFLELYFEKTGNRWQHRNKFVKVPGKMYPIDVDYGENTDEKLAIDLEIPSKLERPIQELIKLIFDINLMKMVMKEFELDTEKMPLGKLSKHQLQKAYGVLTELQGLIESNGSEAQFIDATNRFYTYVPHSFGVDNPPVIKDSDTIKKKIEIIDNLLELEIAYNLMKTPDGERSTDAYYDQLKTDIEILDKETEEFNIIEEYVKNTHAATHNRYELEMVHVFKVKRQGEEERFEAFRKLHNRKLLWHGSRRSNFAGILSQGLRIAPPEAPVSGYMFGKGIYFADMVSKSANFCFTDHTNNIGLMLLCDVALGDMYERLNADYIEKLPQGKHSCKGVGITHPDPKFVKKIGDVEVPVGKPSQAKEKCTLLYNEYIVYDVAQVNIKYLLQMKFKYKY